MSKYGLGLLRVGAADATAAHNLRARLGRPQRHRHRLRRHLAGADVRNPTVRRKSVESLAHLIYDRRTRAGMVVSSMRRNAPLDEIQFRKRAYDEAYVDWNKNILLNLFVIREVGGD